MAAACPRARDRVEGFGRPELREPMEAGARGSGRGAARCGASVMALTPACPFLAAQGIVMPAHFLDDGWHGAANDAGTGRPANLFVDYAAVADAIGVYTTNDYAAIVDTLVRRGGSGREGWAGGVQGRSAADGRARLRCGRRWPGGWAGGRA